MTDFTTDSLIASNFGGEKRVKEATVTKRGRLLVELEQQQYDWPGLWLRYNCQCPNCFHPTSLSNITPLREVLQSNNSLTRSEITNDGTEVVCTWADGHCCTFTADWLYNRRLTEDGTRERMSAISVAHEKVPWTDPVDMIISRATWNEVTETPEGFIKFGKALIRDGIFYITNSPDRRLDKEFADKTGALGVGSLYGFDHMVEYEPNNPVSVVYTSAKLDLHIDFACMGNTPQILFMHFLKPAETGGESIFTDGIKAAYVLKERHPKHYQTLCKVSMEFEDLIAAPDSKAQQYMCNRRPVIAEDIHGRPELIYFSNHAHSSFFNGGSISDLEDWLEAMKNFLEILHEVSITIKAAAGDIVVLDNRRVLHGREPFDPSCSRSLEGFYTDWDYIDSQLRVNQAKVNENQ